MSECSAPEAIGAAMDAGIFTGAKYFPVKWWIAIRSGFIPCGSFGISQ